MEHENGWWTLTFCFFPDQQEEPVTFTSGESFTRFNQEGQLFKCRVLVKGNVFHYTCRGEEEGGESYWGSQTFTRGGLVSKHYTDSDPASACLVCVFTKI